MSQRNDVHLAIFFQMLANSVVHDDRIVERIADDRQQRRDAVEVELHLRHGEQAECQRNLMEQAAERTDTELPFETYPDIRSEEHTSELQSLMRISYAVFCLKKKNQHQTLNKTPHRKQ